jgi:hypothetical protein
MKRNKSHWKGMLISVIVLIFLLVGAGYIFVQYKISKIKSTLSSCNLGNKNFNSAINFEYVSKWIVVKVKLIGSDKEYDFIFDTGAQTVISDTLLKELNPDSYSKINFKVNTKKNAFSNELVTLNGLELGGAKFNSVSALVVKSSEYKMLNCVSPWGIIGCNIIKTSNFQIDYKNKRITITDNLENLTNLENVKWITYRTKNQETPIIPVTINNKYNIDLIFDTGLSGGIKISSSEMYKSIFENYKGNFAKYTTRSAITISDNSDNKPYEGLLFKTTSLIVGDNETKDFVITVNSNNEKGSSGLIGNEYFENFIIILDYKNKRVGFIENGISKKDTNNKSFGVSFLPEKDNIYVSTIYSNSEPESMGIKVNDLVYSINGMIISDLPKESFCKIYRNDYELIKNKDTILNLEIARNGVLSRFRLRKFVLIH